MYIYGIQELSSSELVNLNKIFIVRSWLRLRFSPTFISLYDIYIVMCYMPLVPFGIKLFLINNDHHSYCANICCCHFESNMYIDHCWRPCVYATNGSEMFLKNCKSFRNNAYSDTQRQNTQRLILRHFIIFSTEKFKINELPVLLIDIKS